MELTFEEVKERIREREDPDTIMELLGITIDEICDSNVLDDPILSQWNRMQEIYSEDIDEFDTTCARYS